MLSAGASAETNFQSLASAQIISSNSESRFSQLVILAGDSGL